MAERNALMPQPTWGDRAHNALMGAADYAGRGLALADLYSGGMLTSVAGLNPFGSYNALMQSRDRALQGVPRDLKAAATEPINPLVAMAAIPAAAVRKGEQAVQRGIKAFHGSPHDFDKFDMSRIGSGEGAQAYGHGLYFAESEGVAKSYQSALSDAKDLKFDGVPPSRNAMVALKRNNFDLEAAIADLNALVSGGKATAPEAVTRDLSELQSLRGKQMSTPGRLYEVRIDADPEDFLDWDKPLSQQSESVRSKLGVPPQAKIAEAERLAAEIDKRNRIIDGGGARADAAIREKEELVRQLQAIDPNDAAFWRYDTKDVGARPDSAAKLREAGIPGIKYLDQGSRTAGEGSRNYVLFRDDIVNIVRKYGVAAAISLYGAEAVMQATGQSEPTDG